MASDELTDDFAEKLRHWRKHGLGVVRSGAPRSSRITEVRDDRTGERVGTQTEHWSGQVDATAEKVTVVRNPAANVVI